ncbi:MAG: AAA family ATPase, partial [Victivallales bacterium]|nr:AAA family ATPase [Victivallales bacterium]
MIGRVKEKQYLLEMAEREEAQLVAVYGRRRVGKTYLVRHVFENRILVDHTGLYNVGLAEQLEAFRDSLMRNGAKRVPKLHSWREAFLALEDLITRSKAKERIVFFDELPWMDTPKSSFVAAFEHFWNGWASARRNLMIVFCGSATSWIINKVLKNKGGLHNRVTGVIPLEPFTLAECREYAKSLGLSFSNLDIAECFMVFGGIPYYWSFLRKNESLAQGMDRLLFSRTGALRHEFQELFSSLFKAEDNYMCIVSALAKRKTGMTLTELSSALG